MICWYRSIAGEDSADEVLAHSSGSTGDVAVVKIIEVRIADLFVKNKYVLGSSVDPFDQGGSADKCFQIVLIEQADQRLRN